MRLFLYASATRSSVFGFHEQFQIIQSNCSCRQGYMCELTLLHQFLPGMDCNLHLQSSLPFENYMSIYMSYVCVTGIFGYHLPPFKMYIHFEWPLIVLLVKHIRDWHILQNNLCKKLYKSWAFIWGRDVLIGGFGGTVCLQIFLNLQESWSKGSHAARELATVFSVTSVFVLVTIVGQLSKCPSPKQKVSWHIIA